MSEPTSSSPDRRRGFAVVRGGVPEALERELPRLRRSERRTMAIVSGKGGTGKTNIAANLAIALARRGKRILLVDGDMSLANLDLLMGVMPRFNLQHVLTGEKTLEEIVVETYAGIKLIPAASGVEELADLDDFRRECLVRSLSRLDDKIDLILIDCGSGIARNVTRLARAADEILIVTTPEPTAFSDAYAFIKILASHDGSPIPKVLVNMATCADQAAVVFTRVRKVSEQFLALSPEDYGFIYQDPAVGRAVMNQEPFLLAAPHSLAARSLDRLAQRVLKDDPEPGHGLTGWLDRLKVVNAD